MPILNAFHKEIYPVVKTLYKRFCESGYVGPVSLENVEVDSDKLLRYLTQRASRIVKFTVQEGQLIIPDSRAAALFEAISIGLPDHVISLYHYLHPDEPIVEICRQVTGLGRGGLFSEKKVKTEVVLYPLLTEGQLDIHNKKNPRTEPNTIEQIFKQLEVLVRKFLREKNITSPIGNHENNPATMAKSSNTRPYKKSYLTFSVEVADEVYALIKQKIESACQEQFPNLSPLASTAKRSHLPAP